MNSLITVKVNLVSGQMHFLTEGLCANIMVGFRSEVDNDMKQFDDSIICIIFMIFLVTEFK